MRRRSLWLLAASVLAPLVVLALLAPLEPWREIQLEWAELRDATASTRLRELESATGRADQLRLLEGARQVALDDLEPRREERARIEQELFRLKRKESLAASRWNRLVEQASQSGEDGPGAEEGPRNQRAAERLAREELEALRLAREQHQARLGALLADLRQAEAALAEALEPTENLRRSRDASRLDRLWRKVPYLRRLAPSIHVRQLQPAGSAGAPERCITCHLGADPAHQAMPPGLDQVDDRERRLFAPHPPLDPRFDPRLAGPHLAAEIGCTACHGGEGRSTDFVRAGHRPQGNEILGGKTVQAGCVGCHLDDVFLSAAPLADAGRQVAARTGCASCHPPATGQPEPTRASPPSNPGPGPPLVELHRRTSAAWVAEHLASPRARTPSSWMPDPWASVEPLEKQAEIQAIVAYLFAARPAVDDGNRAEIDRTLARADVRRGAELAETLACRACHLLPGSDSLLAPTQTADLRGSLDTDSLARRFGPSLAGLGAKLEPAWLFEWLTNPPAEPASPRGPRHADFRLDRQEAADLAAFLLADRGRSVSPLDEQTGLGQLGDVRDALLLRRLEAITTLRASRARLDALDDTQRWQTLGSLSVEHRGCAACHALPDTVPFPLGRPLDLLGSSILVAGSSIDRLSWIDSLHADTDWPAAANLHPAEAEALRVYLLGRSMARERMSRPARASARTAGRQVQARHGCRACHAIDGVGGLGPIETAPGARASVPGFDGLGAKLRSDWLFEHLRDPGGERLRPHLGVRMPTFPLDDRERNALVLGFADDAGGALFESPRDGASETLAATVGRVAFSVLACDRCHLRNAEENELAVVLPAPAYEPAGRRLRAEWVERALLDPATTPGTGDLPPNFPLDIHGRPDTAFLVGALETPLFRVQRARLERLFASREELRAYLSDPEQMARALRAHLWSLEGSGAP